MVKKIRFTIDETGEVALSVEGAQGSSCEEFTAPFESLLGQVAERKYKDSYFQSNEAQNEETIKES